MGGESFRLLVSAGGPLLVAGTPNALCALMAEQAGLKAIYLSGAGVSNAAFGVPDLGVIDRDLVVEEVRRIALRSSLPLLVDVDTGWDDPAATAKAVHQAGAAAMHLEDQVEAKRCGHLDGKSLVDTGEMEQRITSAKSYKTADFVIMARTDAYASEGLHATIDRSLAYLNAGAEMIFVEALPSLTEFETFCKQVPAPVLANITEFGKTPLYSLDQLRAAGLAMALFPLTAFRMMNAAATLAYETLAKQGGQQSMLDQMQTRQQLYKLLNYDYWDEHRDLLLDLMKR